MEIKKGYKVRLYPNKKQEARFIEISNGTRFVWNYYLGKRKQEYLEGGKNWNYYDCAKDLTKLKRETGKEWLLLPVHALQQSLRDLDTAYVRFFRRISDFPQFKRAKIDKRAFRIPRDWKLIGNKIRLYKNLVVKFRGTKIVGELKSITISQDNDGKWYGSIVSHQEMDPSLKTGNAIGIDLGIKDLATTSKGEKFENIKPKKILQKKIKQLSQALSRKQKGSKNREQSKLLLAKLHKKISNQRLNHLHQISHRITSENQALIVCEDLSVKNMMQNHKLANSISDVAWGELMRQLEYKQIWRGGEFRKIDRFFPSSKMCSNCNHIVEKLPLSIRSWKCPSCNVEHDRDINAAKNILTIGLSDSLSAESKKSISSN